MNIVLINSYSIFHGARNQENFVRRCGILQMMEYYQRISDSEISYVALPVQQWIVLQKVLNVMEIENLYNCCLITVAKRRSLLSTAKGSCGETRSQSYRAFDYGYINQKELNDMIERTTRLSKKIASFIKYLNNSGFKGTKFKKD